MRRLLLTASALALLMSACTASATPVATTSPTTGSTILRPARPFPAEPAVQTLVAFDACDDFLSYVIDHALDLVGPYGLDTGYVGYPVPVAAVADDRALAVPGGAIDTPEAAPPSQATDGASGFSGTNVQELGVDEPDIVKTDGRRIVALSQQTLVVVDVTGETPRLLGRTTIQNVSVQDLLLVGDRILALGAGYGPVSYDRVGFMPPTTYQSPTSAIVEIDLSSGSPEITRTLEFDGTYTSARLVGSSARVVVNSQPTGFVWAYPEGGGLKAEREAIEKNKEIVRNSDIDNWVPYYVLTNASGDVISEGSMVDCDRARHPKDFAGLDLLTVLSVDMEHGLAVSDATGVLAAGQTVYASADNLYVATQQWYDWRPMEADPEHADFQGVTTQIHQFDISDASRTEYVGSGTVTGFLLNQFAMSEYEGRLRVATTTEPDWRRFGDFEQDSRITVLELHNGELVPVGSVDGLGKGERIYSVRFVEDAAFVVTFRQTDPLYTVDLSDPTDPRVRGELKILGYSAYLHPLGNDLILGVGQAADDTGRTEGTQISLFDVSDLDNPKRIAKLNVAGGSNSTVEYDHHAFLYWAPADLVVVPVQRWSYDDRRGKEQVFFGAVGIDVSGGDLREIGQISHPGGTSDNGVYDWTAQIQRSLVVGDALYTVSTKGLMRSDLQTLDQEVFLDFWA